MNKYITYTARSKLNNLLERTPRAVALRIILEARGGVKIETVFSAYSHQDIIICNNPYVVTDLQTLNRLSDSSIDYSYLDEEFIIKKEPNVIFAIS